MGLRRYSNICMLILLLCAIVVIEVESAPEGESGENSGSKHNDSHEKSKEQIEGNTSDDKHNNTNESDASIGDDNDNNTDDDDNKNDSSLKPGNDEDESDSSSDSDDDNESDISVDISIANGKNDTEKDVKHDIILIIKCIRRTRVIGTLVMHVIQLTKLVFVFVPTLRTPIINYFNSLWVFLITVLVRFNYFLQVITNVMPFLI